VHPPPHSASFVAQHQTSCKFLFSIATVRQTIDLQLMSPITHTRTLNSIPRIGIMLSPFVFATAVATALSAAPEPVFGAITSSLQSILKNTHASADYGYPTDITRDLIPVCFLRSRVLYEFLHSMSLLYDTTVGLMPCLDSRAFPQVRDSSPFRDLQLFFLCGNTYAYIVISDYWRDRPFYTGQSLNWFMWCHLLQLISIIGLSKGCTSTEADVWLYNGTLYVRLDFKSCLLNKNHITHLILGRPWRVFIDLRADSGEPLH